MTSTPLTNEDKQGPTKNAMTSYNLVWRLARPILGLVMRHRAGKGKEDGARINERFARYGENAIPTGALWLHAVSVGESVAALALVDALAKKMPDQHFLITTNTVTAAQLIARNANNSGGAQNPKIHHLYQPLDHPAFVAGFLAKTQPIAAVFMESDFWPNLITQAKASGIPVIFASSQLSARAAARWQTRLGIANIMFGAADLALPVNQEQADTLTALGTDPKVITVLGSLKMAMNALPVDDELVTQLGKAIGKRRIFLAASTHEGEDEIILDVAKKLGNDWLVIIAPRHPSRGPDIAKLCKNHGFAVTMRSGATTSAQLCSEISLGEINPKEINPEEISVGQIGAGVAQKLLLMDSLGEMGSLFTVADIVFLAGSLLPIGGHNPLEPASFGKPIISGPHVFKNSAEFDAMRKAGIVKDADNAAAIAAAATQLWDDKEGRKAMSHAAITYAKNASKRQSVAATKIISILNRKAGAR